MDADQERLWGRRERREWLSRDPAEAEATRRRWAELQRQDDFDWWLLRLFLLLGAGLAALFAWATGGK